MKGYNENWPPPNPKGSASLLPSRFCQKFSVFWQRNLTHTITNYCGLPTAYFSFLNLITVPSQTTFDPSMHLSLADMAVDSRLSPKIISITIKHFRTDQFQIGHNIYLGRKGHIICPVKAMTSHLAVSDSHSRALFKYKNVTRWSFNSAVNATLGKPQLNLTPIASKLEWLL